MGPPSAPSLAATFVAEQRATAAEQFAPSRSPSPSRPATPMPQPAPRQPEATKAPASTPSPAQKAGRPSSASEISPPKRQQSRPTQTRAHASATQGSTTAAPTTTRAKTNTKALPSQPDAPNTPTSEDDAPARPPTREPTRAEGPPPPASASVPAREASGSEADSYWRELAAWLERHKRYPRAARDRRQQGVVHIRFVMDREGHLLSHQLLHSSGHPVLDQEAAQLLRRAAPLPAAPPSIAGEQLEVAIPIHFRLP